MKTDFLKFPSLRSSHNQRLNEQSVPTEQLILNMHQSRNNQIVN